VVMLGIVFLECNSEESPGAVQWVNSGLLPLVHCTEGVLLSGS